MLQMKWSESLQFSQHSSDSLRDWGWLLCICILWWAWWKTQGLGPHRELLRNGRARSGEGHYHQPCDHLCSLPAFYLFFLLFYCNQHLGITPSQHFFSFLSNICFLDAIAASTRHHFAFLGSLVSLFAMEVTSTHCPAWLCTPHWVPCPLQECILYSTLLFVSKLKLGFDSIVQNIEEQDILMCPCAAGRPQCKA